MNRWLSGIVSKSTLLLDTAPLLVSIVGSVDARLLGASQHLKHFEPESWDLLREFGSQYHSFTITPHVATEVSHFLKKIDGKHGGPLAARFSEILQELQERTVPSKAAAARIEFAWLDLADCSLLEVGQDDETLISTDAPLVNHWWRLGLPAFNFNHLRVQAGLL